MEFQNLPSVQGGQDGLGYQTMGYLQNQELTLDGPNGSITFSDLQNLISKEEVQIVKDNLKHVTTRHGATNSGNNANLLATINGARAGLKKAY